MKKTKQKPHKCPYCDYSAGKEGYLTLHMKAKHRDIKEETTNEPQIPEPEPQLKPKIIPANDATTIITVTPEDKEIFEALCSHYGQSGSVFFHAMQDYLMTTKGLKFERE